MPRVRHKFVLAGVLAGAVVCCAAMIATPGRPKFELSLARAVDVRDTKTLSEVDFRFPIQDTNDDLVLIMRVHNSGSRQLTLGREKIQRRATGRWLTPEEVSWLNSMYFVAVVGPRSDAE